MYCKEKLDSVEKLDSFLALPHPELVEMMKRLEGDIMILGIAGKMGVTMGMQAVEAIKAAGVEKKVYGVARFSNPEERVKLDMPELAIICVSSANAQKVVDRLVDCGIQVFWSFANICLQVPPHVVVQREVVAGGYALLSMKRKQHVTG